MSRRLCLALLVTSLWGCSLYISPKTTLAHYDLDLEEPLPATGAPLLPFVLVVHDPAAPAWLDSRNMHYRLAHLDNAEVRHYSNSQWILTPAQMVGQRLRARLAAASAHGGALPDYGIEADYWVRPTLDEFTQIFESPTQSKGVVQLRVVLLEGRRRTFVAQETFRAEEPAPSPDARGAVTALGRASQQAITAAARWIATQLAQPQTPAAGAPTGENAP